MCATSPADRWLSPHERGILELQETQGNTRGEAKAMNVAAKIRARRAEARTRKAVTRAIEQAATPSMRHELITLAQTQQVNWR
jgi:hypothetical protein